MLVRLKMKWVGLALAVLLSVPGGAASAEEFPYPQVDIKRILDRFGHAVERTAEGDYKVTLHVDNDQRTQQVFVAGDFNVITPSYLVWQVWSPAHRSAEHDLPAEIANRLLRDNWELPGAWARKEDLIVYMAGVSSVGTDTFEVELLDAIEYVAAKADRMEAHLNAGRDEF